MVEEAKDAAGDPVITPKGRHRPEGMGVDVPDDIELPHGITDTQTTPKNDPHVEFGGDGKSSQAVPGTV